jgi:hypothetical protein
MNRVEKAAAFLISALLAASLLAFAVPGAGMAQKVRTLSTGVGEEARMPHKDFSLKCVFAERLGPYVAGVKVAIYDADGGKVVETFSAGPWLFVDLPEGSYRVVAQRDSGPKAAGSVTVTAGKQRSLYITW